MSEPGFRSHRLAPHVGSGEGCFWGVVVVLFSFAAFVALKAPNSAPAVVLLLLLGAAPLLLGLKVRRTRLRYAAAQFEVTGPARLGGRLEGVLHLPHAVGEEARVRADLVCQRVTDADSADPVLGQGYAYGSPREPLEPTASQFPLSVDVPSGGLASGHNGAYWTLTCSSQAGFSGLDVAFRVTVEE
jgi:hypothetical protein